MNRLFWALVVFVFLSSPVWAREAAHGYCNQGGHVVVTQGLQSTTDVQQSFPSCTVTVYNAGTSTLSTIYADNSGTVKGNPFTSDANGWWYFYANNGRYDVHFSNSTISSPYTQGDYLLCDPADPTGSFSCGSATGTCPLGSYFSQYTDSASGSDANAGTNWCSAKLLEATAATALASGGTVREAPNYTGASASGVASNVNIFRFNQFDSHKSSMELYSFPDWTDTTEDHLSFFSGASSTPTDVSTAVAALGPFGAGNSSASITGSINVPASATNYGEEQSGVLGVFTTQSGNSSILQGNGVKGVCYDLNDSQDCTGVTAVSGTGSGASISSSYIEGVWSNISLLATPTGAMAYVARATGGHLPSAVATADTYGNAAFDVRAPSPGTPSSGNIWPTGIYLENWTTTNGIYLGLQASATGTPNSDRGNNSMKIAWQYALSTTETSELRVDGSTTTGNVGGNFQFLNNRQSSTVDLNTQADGHVQVGNINAVTFSATPTFDRSIGMIQTITLTGNVTSSTLTNCSAGDIVIFDIIEDGSGAHTFSAPANLHGFGSITTTASYHNRQTFYCTGGSSSSEGYSVSAMQSGT